MIFEWKRIAHKSGNHQYEATHRAKVIGGWLIKNEISFREDCSMVFHTVSESMVFIPDLNHKWEITEG